MHVNNAKKKSKARDKITQSFEKFYLRVLKYKRLDAVPK